jgi:hypothetical protein
VPPSQIRLTLVKSLFSKVAMLWMRVLFYTSKDTISTIKTQPIQWGKIFVGYSSEKRLISRIEKELQKLNIKRTNTPINKWAKRT